MPAVPSCELLTHLATSLLLGRLGDIVQRLELVLDLDELRLGMHDRLLKATFLFGGLG